MKLKIVFLITVILMLMFSLSVQANFSGSQILTLEQNPIYGPITINTSVLEYSIGDSFFISFLVDRHPISGLLIDLSTTKYFNPFRKILYITAGIRREITKGIRDGPKELTPYITFSYRF